MTAAFTPDPGDATLLVRFWMDAYKNDAKSKEANRPIFDDVPWCEIKVPGERDTVTGPVHRMNPDPRLRFPAAWAAFEKDHSSEGQTGTPLKLWPGVTRAEVENLAYNSIKTVEQLAAVSDSNIGKVPGGIALRQRARDHVKAATNAAPVAALSAELEQARAQIAALQAQVADLADAKKRGRKAPEA